MIRKSATMTRQGIAPWRGTGEVFEAEPFFLILVAAIQERLERSAKTARAVLFFEEAVECRAGIIRIARCGDVPVISYLHDRRGGKHVAGNGHARREELAGICLVFDGDALRNRLQALEARGRIEVHALFAAMQRRPAFRAVSLEIYVGRQSDRAVKASRSNHVLDQAGKLRSGDIDGRARALLLRLVEARVGSAVRILISVLPVFAISVHFG